MHAKANLLSFLEGMHYDLRWRHYSADLYFWSRQAHKYGGPVLDLSCGTGRVPLHLARAGYRVTGIEASEALLREAHRKCLRTKLSVEWVHHDIRRFRLGTRFPLVIFPLNSISSLIEAKDLHSCFDCVRRHLAPKGRFVIDCSNPQLENLLRDSSKRFPHSRYPAPSGRGTVEVTESTSYDACRQVNFVRLYHKMPREESEFVEEMAVRIYFPAELDALLRYNGFVIEAKYGDYNESGFDSPSPKQLMVCSVPG
jgi:SAM-dependent methyltransferase